MEWGSNGVWSISFFCRRAVGVALMLLAFGWVTPVEAGGLACPGKCIGGVNHGDRCLNNAGCPGAGSVCNFPPGCIYLEWRPRQVVVPPGGVAELKLYAYSNDGFTYPFEGMDVILNWDETRASLLGKRDPCQACVGGANSDDLCTDNSGCPGGNCLLPDGCFVGCPAQTYGWFSSFFPADCQLDGLNAPCPGGPANDGDGFYQAVSHSFCGKEEVDPAMAPPLGAGSGGIHITSFRFQPLIQSGGFSVSIPLDQGDFTHTRVVGVFQPGDDALGFIGLQAEVTVSNVCDTPTVSAMGCRYIGVTPAAGTSPVAIRVRGSSTDTSVACVTKYVQAACAGGSAVGQICDDNADCPGSTCQNTGLLGDTAVYRLPSQWGTVAVRGSQIQPSKSYRVQTDCAQPPGQTLSTVVNVTMRPWGDATGTGLPVSFIDITKVVDGFRGIAGITIESADMTGNLCIPQRVVNFIDVTATVDAFRTIPFACTAPCP